MTITMTRRRILGWLGSVALGACTVTGGGGDGDGGAVGSDADGSVEFCPIAVDTTPGRWRTALNPASGRFDFIAPDGTPAVVRGISMTGIETGTRETASGAGFWLFLSDQAPEATNAPVVLRNVVDTLATWNPSVVRIPICGSAWAQDYAVHDFSDEPIGSYRDWIDVAVAKARANGQVVIIDNHLWAIAPMGNGTTVDRGTFTSNGRTHEYSEFEDGSTGINKIGTVDSSAPSDWYTADAATWQCPIANADGVTMHNAYYNKDRIAAMWRDIAARYKDDSGVWFELYNEPYSRTAPDPFPAAGANQEEVDYPWDLWAEFMLDQIKAIRDGAEAPNIIIVSGLDFGYDFGPTYGPIAHPAEFLPWACSYPNIAYSFHPYQHGTCCGAVGASGTDLSASDPYESAFCSYYEDGTTWGTASGAALPSGTACTNRGYAPTSDKKMPPCTWVEAAFNPKTGLLGLCAGDRALCNDKAQAECESVDPASPAAGGWSEYVLPMAKYGPLIATEYGSFDCSSPYVKTLLAYMETFGISYTAWALWPQNSGGPEGLGSCGYPSVMTPAAAPGDFRACFDAGGCASLMQPMPWSGLATHEALTSH
jgi:hypothetical protein